MSRGTRVVRWLRLAGVMVVGLSAAASSGQAAAEQLAAEQPAVEQPAVEQPAVEQPTMAEMPVAEMPVAEMPVAQMPVAEMPVAQMPVAQMPVAEMPVAQMPVVPTAVAKASCSRAPTNTTTFYVEQAEIHPRDSVVSMRLCLASVKPIGSYMVTLKYDSARVRVRNVEGASGMQAANAAVAGVVRIAGASPTGFANGVLATVIIAPRDEKAGQDSAGRRATGAQSTKATAAIELVVEEASTVAGTSVTREVHAIGWPPRSRATSVTMRIDSISPRSGEADRDRVTDVAIYGSGFAAAANTVLFGDTEVTGLLSENGGTIIRFAVPAYVGSGDRVRRIEPGEVLVRVKHDGATSNPVKFTVRGGDL